MNAFYAYHFLKHASGGLTRVMPWLPLRCISKRADFKNFFTLPFRSAVFSTMQVLLMV
jgi:hypothetical protein